MVRERVGDWRSAWRFALAGLLAGVLVVATSQAAVVAPLFFALQDQLFPAPAPSSQVTLVALDSTAARPFGPFPWGNDVHAEVINYLASLHPKVILFDVMLDHSGTGDAELAKAIADAGNVVLVCTADDSPLPIFAGAAAAVAGRELGVPDPANAVRNVPIRIAKSYEMPGLQLKGKAAETFRLFNVTAIRQDKASPWVQFPTATAMSSYSEHRQRS